MVESSPAQTSDALMSSLGEHWIPAYSKSSVNGDPLFVYRHAVNRQRMKIFQREPLWPAGTKINVPYVGTMHCYDVLDDPALAELREMVHRYPTYEVLRYRPGKRLTIAAVDPCYGPVIIKCVAHGIDPIFGRLAALQCVRCELAFQIGEPYLQHRGDTVFMQRRLDGHEPCFYSTRESRRLSARMADAVVSLHRSNASFDATFNISDQMRRSARYLEVLRKKLPALHAAVDRLDAGLDNLARTIPSEPKSIVPIHGSLHSHQWLVAGEELALVDFDRAAMGHAELDISTFLTEWDYEPGTRGEAIKHEFLAGFSRYDESKLQFYRAHKHLAKAFKAAKDTDPARAARKCQRNLENARALLA